MIAYAERGSVVAVGDVPRTVAPACVPQVGYLFCVTHECRLYPAGHVPPGREEITSHLAFHGHKLVWICETHGPECVNRVEYNESGAQFQWR